MEMMERGGKLSVPRICTYLYGYTYAQVTEVEFLFCLTLNQVWRIH